MRKENEEKRVRSGKKRVGSVGRPGNIRADSLARHGDARIEFVSLCRAIPRIRVSVEQHLLPHTLNTRNCFLSAHFKPSPRVIAQSQHGRVISRERGIMVLYILLKNRTEW